MEQAGLVAVADLEISPWEDLVDRAGLVVLAGLEEVVLAKDSASKAAARFRAGSLAAVAQGEAAECFA